MVNIAKKNQWDRVLGFALFECYVVIHVASMAHHMEILEILVYGFMFEANEDVPC